MTLTRCRAFTLLEMTIGLVVVALMVGFALQAVPSGSANNCYQVTRAQLEDIQAAITEYTTNNGKYPEPTSLAVANAASGSANTTRNSALYGGLPWRTLGLQPRYASDCWGNKFTYVVTQNLTTTGGYSNSANRGNLTVRTGTLASTNALTTYAAYVVISHGADGWKANPRSGTGFNHCDGITGNRIDRENCDIGSSANAIFYNSGFDNGSTSAVTYYDDLIVFSDRFDIAPADCLAGAYASWNGTANGCSYTLTSTLPHSTSLTNQASTTTNPSGTANILCTNGVLSTSSATCTASGLSCAALNPATWGSGNCSSSLGAGTPNENQTLNFNNGTYSGTSSWTCNSGTGVWTLQAGSSCSTVSANCSPVQQLWSNCRATPGGTINHGNSAGLTNDVAGYTGNVTVTCNNGTLSMSNPSCSLAPSSDCSGTVTWGGNCSATVGSLANGASTGVTNSAIGYTGSGTASCNSGTLSATGTCNANCNAGSVTWLTTCSGSATSMNHGGAAQSVTNTAAGYSGSASVSCNNGVFQTATETCTSTCSATSISGYRSPRVWVGDAITPVYDICALGIPNGQQFTMETNIDGSGWAPLGPEPQRYIRSWSLTKGSASSQYYWTRNQDGSGKNDKIDLIYDGNCSVYGRARYYGPSSDYKHVQIALTNIDTCVVNGGWSAWYGPYCNNNCGTGTLVSYRYCNNPVPKNGGTPCSGSSFNDTGTSCDDMTGCDTGTGGGMYEGEILDTIE